MCLRKVLDLWSAHGAPTLLTVSCRAERPQRTFQSATRRRKHRANLAGTVHLQCTHTHTHAHLLYAHIHTCMHAGAHTHGHTLTGTHIHCSSTLHTLSHVLTNTGAHTHGRAHIHARTLDTYTHTHTCLHTRAHAHTTHLLYTRIHKCLHTHACTLTCMHTYVHTHHNLLYTCIHKCLHTYVRARMQAHIHAHTYYAPPLHTFTHACTHLHAHTHTHGHAHSPSQLEGRHGGLLEPQRVPSPSAVIDKKGPSQGHFRSLLTSRAQHAGGQAPPRQPPSRNGTRGSSLSPPSHSQPVRKPPYNQG